MHKDEKGEWVPNYVIVSPREAKSVVVTPQGLKNIVLFINKDKKELKNKEVLHYIQQGEREDFHHRLTCSSRNRWYELEYRTPWPILHPMIHHDRQTVLSNKHNVQVDHNFFEIKPKRKRDTFVLFCFLLSTVSMLFKEIAGRTNLGEGALKTEGIDIKKLPVLKTILKSKRTKLRNLSREYPSAKIDSVFKDIGTDNPDGISLDKISSPRRELDKIIMGDILGLTEAEQLEVYQAVVDLVRSRIEKARSFGKKGKTKEGLDLDLLTKTIKEKFSDKALRNFYEDKILSQTKLKTIQLFEAIHPVKTENGLFGWRVTSGKNYIDCQNEAEAFYLKIWLELGRNEVSVPTDVTYISKVLPELQALKEKIDRVIADHISFITSQKLRKKILQKLQGELFE